MSQIQSSSLRMERRDQDTIRNPPHQICSRCVYLFLNQFASTRASHEPAYIDERGRRPIACVAGVESGRDWEEGKRVAGVGEMGRKCKGFLPFSQSRFSPSSPTPPLFVYTTKASLFI